MSVCRCNRVKRTSFVLKCTRLYLRTIVLPRDSNRNHTGDFIFVLLGEDLWITSFQSRFRTSLNTRDQRFLTFHPPRTDFLMNKPWPLLLFRFCTLKTPRHGAFINRTHCLKKGLRLTHRGQSPTRETSKFVISLWYKSIFRSDTGNRFLSQVRTFSL